MRSIRVRLPRLHRRIAFDVYESQITCASAGITNLNATGSFALVTNNTVWSYTQIETFKYDPLKAQYILNWPTPKLPKGTYRISANFGDGSVRTVDVILK